MMDSMGDFDKKKMSHQKPCRLNNFFAEENLLYIVRKLLENSVFQSTYLGAKYFLSIELQSIFLKKFFHQQLLGEPPC